MSNSSNSTQSSFLITCSPGLEKFVANEINQLQLTLDEMGKGVVRCSGTVKAIYKYCLYSRFANRVLYQINEFFFQSLDDLYDQAKLIAWDEWFSLDKTFAIQVSATSINNEEVKDPRILALKVKDAIADYFSAKYRKRPSVEAKRPDFPIHLFVNKNQAALSLDMSGESLHQRGYRVAQGDAPIKENLAAALFQFSELFDSASKQNDATFNKEKPSLKIVDPMCGSGTLLIEAAYALKNIAPGVERDYFGFTGWIGHRPKLWQQILQAAKDDKEAKLAEKQWPKLIGYDADNKVLQAAKKNIAGAGLKEVIHTERKDLHQFYRATKGGFGDQGLLIVNPPYGERIEDIGTAEYLYTFLGRLIRENLSSWRVVCISNRVEFLDQLQLQTEEQMQLYNGPIKCVVRRAHVDSSDNDSESENKKGNRADDLTLELTDKTVAGAEAFCNRLRKNWKGLKKWVKDESITCFRLYDADIPEFNVAVDLYHGNCHVQEYAPPKSIDPAKAAQRLSLAVEALVKVLDLPKSKIFLKVREKQKGKNQYKKVSSSKRFFVVKEGECYLLVNLTDYLDTGLFLDHRPIRVQIGSESRGKRVLNLFSYTGSATVHAAVGGAKSTTSVDLSSTYCDWARANLALNGFSSANHDVIRSDVLKWLERTTHQYDLIFMDPPTFSNSKKLRDHFDVQKDHAAYLDLAMRRLERGGTLYFSTNYRRFELDEDKLGRFDIKEISNETLPKDFARRQKIHRCWQLQHREKKVHTNRKLSSSDRSDGQAHKPRSPGANPWKNSPKK